MKKKIIAMLLTLATLFSVFPVNVFATENSNANETITFSTESSALITVDEKWANPGSTIEMSVAIEENPGILGATLTVSWDERLTLVSDTSGTAFSHMTYTSPSRYIATGTNFVWFGNEVSEGVDGTVLTLTFKVSESAVNNNILPISITYTDGDVVDGNDNDVNLTILNGYVRVINYKPGDVTGDNRVNARDLVRLSQYISDGYKTDPEGYNAEVVLDACDVNGDGRVNARDLIRLSQYISDGGQTKPDGYNAVLEPAKMPQCEHIEVIDEAVLPTCTTTGLTEGSHCSLCNEIIKAQTIVPVTGHYYIWSIDKEATQTETGLKHEYCYLCGETRNENTVIPLAPHTHSFEYTEAVVATCTVDGSIAHWTCTDCGKIYKDALGANEISANDIVVKAQGHTEYTVKALEATCTEDGSTEGSYCSACGLELTSVEIIPATGHSYKNEICTKCGAEEDKPLEVTSVSVDKSLLMANDEVTFTAITNKENSKITLSADIYLDGVKVATISDTGTLNYSPTTAGRYDAEVTVTDGDKTFKYSLNSCFDVKAFWSLEQLTANANKIALGELLTFSADIDGDTSDLDYTITVYKDGVSYYSMVGAKKVDFYPNVAGSYSAVITVTDSYGETQTVQSSNVVVESQNITNPILSVNYGTTLNLDELKGKDGDEIVVPSGKNIIITWNKLSTDSYYRLDVYARNNDSDTYDEVFKNYTSNSYTISSSNLIAGHEYRAMISRYDASGNSVGSAYVTFTVAGTNSIMMEKRFEVISPIDDAVYAQNDITVQWTKLNYASKYVLSLEYHCGKSYHDVLENIEISNTQNTYTIPKSILHQGCKHRLKVYAYDSLGNELYESLIFRMEGDEAIFELDKPEITATYFYEDWTDDMKSYPTYEDIVVTWTDIPAASYYSISIDSHYTVIDDPVITNADNITDNTFTIPVSALVSGCVYSVRVSAYCSDGHKYTSDRGYFRVPYANGSTIHGPEVISHELSKDKNDPTCMVEQALTITWAPVSAASTYNIYWSEVGYEDWPEYESKGQTSTSVTIPNDCIYTSSTKGYTDFELQIVAKDSNGIAESAYYYIRMLESTIEAPVVSSPKLPTDDEANLPSFDDDFTISWNAVAGAVSYRVRIYEFYDDGYEEIYTQEGITTTSFEIPLDELYMGGQFKLTVRAYDQYGNGKGSTYYFVVGEPDYVGLTVDNWNPSYEADYKYTFIETVGSWTAKTSASWITLSSTSGIGTTRLKVSVTENTDSFARVGNIVFTNANGGTAVFSITQAANGSSNTGIVQITSPSQGDTIEKDVVTVKWTCKYGYHYFNLTLTDLTDNEIAYTENTIVSKYCQIPESYIEKGHTYQLTIGQYYNDTKNSEASIIFKVSGNSDSSDPDEEDNNEQEEIIPVAPSLDYVSNGNGTCYVSGIGTYTGTNMVIPSVSPSGEKVVGIAASAFNGNTAITSVYISENVTSIGKEAFANCSKLQTIDLPNSLTSIGNAAFWGCSSLASIVIPCNVTIIDYAAFSHCTALAEVKLPTALKTIGEYGFYKCSSISTMEFIGTAEQWMSVNKADTWADESSISIITFTEASTPDETPDANENLEFTSYGNGECYVSGIGSYTGTVITIPSLSPDGDKVVKIGANAFAGNTNLIRINIPANVTSIGNYAFNGCTALKTVNMSDTLSHIGTGAFKGCTALNGIELPQTITYLSNETFYGCTSLKAIVLSENITEIGERCFYGCKSIMNISLPNKLNVIGNFAFAQCTSIGYIYIPENVTTIGNSAFAGSALLRATISNTVETIGSNAFNAKWAIDIYYQGTESELKTVTKGSNWDGTCDNLYYNVADYVIEFPFETVTLPVSNRSVILMPMYGYGYITIYDVKTWKVVEYSDVTGIVFEAAEQAAFTVKSDGTIMVAKEVNGTIVGDGGYGVLSIYYYKNNKKTYISEGLAYCVVESESVYAEGSDKSRFSDIEKEYIIYSLDLVFSARYIKAPDFPEWNYGDEILNNIVNLSDNLASLFQGKWGNDLGVEDAKRVLAAFIQDYIDTHNPNTDDMTQMVADTLPALIDWVIEIAKNVKDISEFPKTVQNAINTVVAFSEAVKTASVTESQLSAVIDSLTLLIDYNDSDLRALMAMSKKCVNWFNAYGVSMESAKYTLHTIKKASSRIIGILGAVEIGFDTFMYMTADYTVNLQILEQLKTQFEKNYDSDDDELRAINELIAEYENKYATAISNMLADIAAKGVEFFAGKAPGFGLILQIAKWGAATSSAPAKADLIGFLMFTYAMGGCMDDPYNVFLNGKRSSDFDTLKETVCIYLNMVIYANELAILIKDSDYPNTDKYEANIVELLENLGSYIYIPIS